MPINFSSPPKGVLRDSASEVRSLAGDSPADSTGEVGGGADGGSSTQSLPLFSIPMSRLAEGGDDALSHAERQGWRMIMDDGGTDRLVDHIDRVGVSSISSGLALEGLRKAGAMAASKISAEIDYEPRILDFGRLGRSALWLHAPDPAVSDRFFTMGREPHEVSEGDFMSDAISRAQVRMSAMAQSGSVQDALRDGDSAPGEPNDVGG